MSSLANEPSDKTVAAEALMAELRASLQDTADEIVPWFVENMPRMYFQDTDHASQLTHLRAMIAAKASGRPFELTLRSEDGLQITSMRPHDKPGVLAELVAELPHDPPLRAAKIHTALDGNLVLDTFEFGTSAPFDPADPVQAAKLAQTIEFGSLLDPPLSAAEVTEHFHRCHAEYILTLTPLRLCKQLELYRELTGSDASTILLERESNPRHSRIVVAVANATTRRMLERIARRLADAQVHIHRAYLDVIRDNANGSITLLGFVVESPDGGPIDEASELWRSVREDLRQNKWQDMRTLNLAYRHAELNTRTAEVITGLCDLCHQVLVKRNPYAFTTDRLHHLAEANLDHSRSIAELLLARFNPDGHLDDETFRTRAASIQATIDNSVDLEDARTVLGTMLKAVAASLRTNVHLESRFGFALRLDPAFLATPERSELPYGVFFVHGRGFNGFHVRFRDIARGGLRAVRTRSEDQHAREAERLYDEAYNLAFAQQLKNKDIPEGGAKAAILLDPYASLAVDRCVKGFVNCLLDLITPEPTTRSRVIDLFGREELLYIGPDENITPYHIEWIVAQARRRGYPLPTALMSSKPGAGINHKEYGVTSEGVNVFLEVALKSIGIDPKAERFTVKMTGGPDGDVGGNMLRILHRDYGTNPRIIGIADGSGAGEDPEGLDWDELLRLFDAGDPIAAFDRSKLGPHGRVVGLDEPDGVHLRNTLHERLVADAFVPCGGRPNAIHSGNWRNFLQPDGTPSAKVIVEGANLYLTPEARRELSEHGVMIFKDSSANKCGVITSSYEICSNMNLTEEEFLPIKPRFVEEVLVKLRALARREAELLVRCHQYHPHIPLPEMSIRISRVMIRAADAIEEAIAVLPPEDTVLLRELVVDHLPPVLIEVAGDRVWKQTPERYLAWIQAKTLAARMVYREGPEHLEAMPMAAIASLAVKYLRLELERASLASEIERSNLPSRDRIASVIRRAGILTALDG